MLAKLIAAMALLVISFGLTLSNYWFVFHLWPQNWTLFFLFALLQLFIVGLQGALHNSK